MSEPRALSFSLSQQISHQTQSSNHEGLALIQFFLSACNLCECYVYLINIFSY